MSIQEYRPSAEQMEDLISAVNSLASGQGTEALDATFQAMMDGTNTTRLFRQWWPLAAEDGVNRYERLNRFARMLSAAWSDKKYTLRYVDLATSSASAMTPLDDLAGKSAAGLCTAESVSPAADWADEDPMTWYVRANALSLADGTMNVLAVEGVDDGFDLTGETAPVYTFCLALWYKRWKENGYCYKSWATVNKGGYRPYAGDVAPDNSKRALTWHPTFPGGLDANGGLTSGIGKAPYLWKSGLDAIVAARKVTAYEGLWNDCDTIWALDMWQLRHFNLENSDILNGCQSYNYQYNPALGETSVKRVLLTTAQAANLVVGSNMELGERSGQTNPNTDRNSAYNYNIFKLAKITKIEEVTIDSTTYAAVYVDVDTAFTTTTTCLFSTMPWDSGVTEAIPGHKDGAVLHLTNGKSPMRVQGVELMSGAYDIGLDPLYNVTNYANSKGDYAVYECKDSEDLTTDGTITNDYTDTGISFSQMPSGWQYVKDFAETDKGVLFPSAIGGGSGTYYKSAFLGAGSAGVRCPWRFGYLSDCADCGLACGNGDYPPGSSGWSGRPRLCGAGKKRGEWPT